VPRNTASKHASQIKRRPAEASAQSPTMILFVVIGVLGIIAYGSFLLNPVYRGDTLPYILVIGAESVLLLTALMSMWTILAGSQDPRDFSYHHARERLFSLRRVESEHLGDDARYWPMRIRSTDKTVAVFITTYGEDLDVIRRTVDAAMRMLGKHATYVLDDGHSDDVKSIAHELGAGYIRRVDRVHAKAGNVNHALSIVPCDFFVIFDADFVPDPNFLINTMPFFARPAVAFVQTPQTYGNLKGFIAVGAGYMQTVFYKLIQPGRNRFNAAFCVGTNVIFRRTAIDEVGGMYTASKSEDVWTSLMLHERGWKSIFLPETLAVGDAPETISAYAKQQLRWATGGFEILLTHNPLSRKRHLTLDQRLQYLVTATHYLTGIVPALLLLVPPLEIYFDLRPMSLSVSAGTWILFYSGFYVCQILLAFYAVGSFKWQTLLLSAVSFPIYIKAFTNVLTGKQTSWSATGAKKGYDSPFNYVVPQMLVTLFMLLTSLVGIWRDLDNGVFTLATAWSVTNTMVLFVFVATAFKESHQLKREARVARRVPATVRITPSVKTVTASTPIPVFAGLSGVPAYATSTAPAFETDTDEHRIARIA
jgi:cellulose synthase (UDP-forming)